MRWFTQKTCENEGKYIFLGLLRLVPRQRPRLLKDYSRKSLLNPASRLRTNKPRKKLEIPSNDACKTLHLADTKETRLLDGTNVFRKDCTTGRRRLVVPRLVVYIFFSGMLASMKFTLSVSRSVVQYTFYVCSWVRTRRANSPIFSEIVSEPECKQYGGRTDGHNQRSLFQLSTKVGTKFNQWNRKWIIKYRCCVKQFML